MRNISKTFVILGLTMLSIFMPVSDLNKFEKIPPPSPIFETIVEKKNIIPSFESFPVHLSIQSIGVEAAIQAVGVLDGAMAVPDSKDYVGWYKFGTRPGEIGSAVLAGHVNWKHGEEAVFSSLKYIQIGDIVAVYDNFGRENKFIVRQIKNYPIDTNTVEIFKSTDGISRLNLITCYGTWDPERKTHNLRLVVFAEKI